LLANAVYGNVVGNRNDIIIMSYGQTVSAVNTAAENSAQTHTQPLADAAREYLAALGLDFTQDFGTNEYLYIHCASLVLEMDVKKGIPASQTEAQSNTRENTTFGCAMQALGIETLYESWFDRFSTKRALISAVGKLATRYLSYFGAAVAVYDFIDCMWG
jgi:hypothetical protein